VVQELTVPKQWGDKNKPDPKRKKPSVRERIITVGRRDADETQIKRLINQGKSDEEVLKALGKIDPQRLKKVKNKIKTVRRRTNTGNDGGSKTGGCNGRGFIVENGKPFRCPGSGCH
jgi:hypothetical protein